MADHYRSAVDIAAGVNSGEVDPVELVDAAVERIEERNDVTNAFVTVIAEEAREQAREVRERVSAGEDLPLAGVPLGIKDLGDTKEGVVHTRGLAPLADDVADETALTVRRLEEAGAVPVGTTNTPALGHTVRTVNDVVGPTGTPFDPERNAGGSSGGSAAALADGLVALATGSDVGGSLRNPAACCNVVSVKPTHGLVPNGSDLNGFHGHTPVSVRGPMARDTRSLGRMLDVMAGAEPRDPAALEIAYSPGLDLFPVAPETRDSIESTLADLERAGATVEEVELDTPDRHTVNETYMTTVTAYFAETVEELNRDLGYDLLEEHEGEVPDQLREIVEVGESHDITAYTNSNFPRTDLYRAVQDVVEGYDALVCPTVATPPLTHDEPFPPEIDGVETEGMPTDWAMAWVFNLTGHPVVNVPADLADGLPVGMQVVGPTFSEADLLGVAATVEEVSPWGYPGA